MNDYISRQAAIAHAVPLNLFGREVMMVSVSELENLPSAQADVPDTNVGDLISRQAAIDAVDDVPYIKEHPNEGLLWKAWIEQMPSAQPEVTEEAVKDFCRKRCLTILTNDYFHKLTSTQVENTPSVQSEREECEEREQGLCPFYAG